MEVLGMKWVHHLRQGGRCMASGRASAAGRGQGVEERRQQEGRMDEGRGRGVSETVSRLDIHLVMVALVVVVVHPLSRGEVADGPLRGALDDDGRVGHAEA